MLLLPTLLIVKSFVFEPAEEPSPTATLFYLLDQFQRDKVQDSFNCCEFVLWPHAIRTILPPARHRTDRTNAEFTDPGVRVGAVPLENPVDVPLYPLHIVREIEQISQTRFLCEFRRSKLMTFFGGNVEELDEAHHAAACRAVPRLVQPRNQASGIGLALVDAC